LNFPLSQTFLILGTKAGVREAIEVVGKISQKNNGGKFEFAKNEKEKTDLWSARKEALFSVLSLREKGGEVWTTDGTFPFFQNLLVFYSFWIYLRIFVLLPYCDSVLIELCAGKGYGLTIVAVPISKLPELIEQSKKSFDKSGLHTTIVSHALDGNFRRLP
jgi:D-lactate dehydrogenase (cytochrome)